MGNWATFIESLPFVSLSFLLYRNAIYLPCYIDFNEKPKLSLMAPCFSILNPISYMMTLFWYYNDII